MSVARLRRHRKAATKTKPFYRTGATGSITTGTTLGVLIPNTAVAGDVGFAVVSTNGSVTVTPPAGWSQIGPTGSPAAGVSVRCYLMVVAAGDLNATRNFTLSANTVTATVAWACWGGVGAYAVAPNMYVSSASEVTNNKPMRFPSAWTFDDCLIVGLSGAISALSTAATHGSITTPPTGFTIRQTVSRQNTLTTPRGGTIMEADNHPLALETFDYPAQAHCANLILALSPVAPKWSKYERIPAALNAKPVYVYGTSSSACVEHPTAGSGYMSRTPWGERIMAATANGASTNYSMPGSRAADICAYMFGTRSMATRAVSGNALSVARVGTASGLTKDALYVTDLAGNDAISGGGGAQSKLGVQHATNSIFRLIRSSSITNATDVSVTYSGSWSTASSDGAQGGQYRYSSTNGNTASITVTDKPAVDLVLIGADNTSLGNTGAAYEVLVDGVVVASGTTHNQMLATGWGQNYKFVQQTVSVTGIPAGTHTVTVRHAGTAGSMLLFNAYMFPSTNPGWIVAAVLPEYPASTYSTYSFSKAQQDEYREVVRGVASQFVDGKVLLYDPSERGRWDTTWLSPDGVHQDERGHAHYSHEVFEMLGQRVA